MQQGMEFTVKTNKEANKFWIMLEEKCFICHSQNLIS
jgi:hypothetical protein